MTRLDIFIDKRLAHKNEAIYVFRTFCAVMGLGMALKENPQDAQINYSSQAQAGAINIVPDDYSLWFAKIPQAKMVEGKIILSVHGSKHERIFERLQGRVSFNYDIIAASFYMLSRMEERQINQRDIWGCFPAKAGIAIKEGFLEFPVLNGYIRLLEEILSGYLEKKYDFLPRWPNNYDFCVCLHHDVDRPFKGDFQSAGNILKTGRGMNMLASMVLNRLTQKLRGSKDEYYNFDEYMDLEEGHGFKSTFNFTAPALRNSRYDPLYSLDNPRITEAIKRVLSRGFKVGLHAGYDSYLDARVIETEKKSLEKITGASVKGVLQHYLRLECPDTWEKQAQAGLEYDMTLGYNEAVGFRAQAAFPFYPYSFASRQAIPVLVLPLVIMDGTLFLEMKLSAEEATEKSIGLLSSLKESGGCASVLWHINTWCEKDFPGYRTVYKNVMEWLGRQRVWVTSGEELCGWWKNRSNKLCAG